MVHNKAEYKKVEQVTTYYEGIVTEHYITCDECKEEIKDGDTQCEVELCKDDADVYGESFTLCTECLKREFNKWMEDPKGAFTVNFYKVDNSKYIGKKSTLSEPVYEMMEKLKK